MEARCLLAISWRFVEEMSWNIDESGKDLHRKNGYPCLRSECMSRSDVHLIDGFSHQGTCIESIQKSCLPYSSVSISPLRESIQTDK